MTPTGSVGALDELEGKKLGALDSEGLVDGLGVVPPATKLWFGPGSDPTLTTPGIAIAVRATKAIHRVRVTHKIAWTFLFLTNPPNDSFCGKGDAVTVTGVDSPLTTSARMLLFV